MGLGVRKCFDLVGITVIVDGIGGTIASSVVHQHAYVCSNYYHIPGPMRIDVELTSTRLIDK